MSESKRCNENSLGRVIYMTAHEMRNFAEKLLKPYDLTLEQIHLLKNMPENYGITQKDIGEIANKKPANMTRILDRLERKDLVVRKESPEDRRATLVFLTQKGRELVGEVQGSFVKVSDKLVLGITQEEQEMVRKVLDRISANINRINDEIDE